MTEIEDTFGEIADSIRPDKLRTHRFKTAEAKANSTKAYVNALKRARARRRGRAIDPKRADAGLRKF